MKRTRFIPLLITPLLLTGCNPDLTVVSKPNFASLGQEVSYSDFQEEVKKGMDKSDIFGEALLKSKELSIKSASAQSRIYSAYENASSSSKKVISKKVVGSVIDGTIKYDATKLIALAKSTSKSVSILKDSTVDSKETSTAKSETGLAVVNLDDGKSAVNFNNLTMAYTVSKAFGDGDEPAAYVDMQMKMVSLMYVYMPFMSNLPEDTAGEEEMGKYHFYQNGSIFTYTYNSQESVDIDESDVVIARLSSTTEVKVQLELEENKQSLKYYYCDRFETQYLNEYQGSHPGERDEEKIESSADISVKSKSVSLKKINISKYEALE